MKRVHKTACQHLSLLLVLLLTVYGGTQPVNAEAGYQNRPSPVFVGFMTPDIPATLCTGQKINLEYYFAYLSFYSGKAPPLVPNMQGTVTLSAHIGKVAPGKFSYPKVIPNSTYTGKFTYTAGKEAGNEMINIKVTTGKITTNHVLPFEVINCKASIQFSQTTSYSYDIVTMTTTYSGSGDIGINADGKISGSGSHSVWGDILPYSDEGASCVHSPPWEGTASISFNGEIGKDGTVTVTMNLAELATNSTNLVCTGDDQSGSMPFPAYTYSACQVRLEGFSFTAATLQVPFNCPGEGPFTMAITVIPRR